MSKNKKSRKQNRNNNSITFQIQQTVRSQQGQQHRWHQQPDQSQNTIFNKHEVKELLWKKERCKAFWVWLSLNAFVAGLLCIVVGVLKNCCFGDERLFYVINKEAYSGYFYALSISLLAGSLSSLFIGWVVGHNNKGRVALAILSIIILCIAVGSYVSHSEKLVKLNTERDVKNINIEELVGSRTYKMYKDKCIDIDKLADSIDTEILFDSIIDKEQLKNTLVHVKLRIAEPEVHVNWLLIILTLSSFTISIITRFVTYPNRPQSNG